MPSERALVRFEELCDIKRGASPRPIQDWMAPEGIPWVKISDATAAKSRFIGSTAEFIKKEGGRYSVAVHPGDFILSNSATPGLPKIMRIDACIHDGWLLLRNFRRITKEYCYYLLLNERPKLVAQGNGSVFTNLKTEILKNHVVEVPAISEQVGVTDTLLALDDRIDLLRQTNTTLESIAQTLFKSWFVDFDPVRAKQAGREPEGMDAATAALFPAEFAESALGLIPKGWQVGVVEDLLVLQRGFDLPASQRIEGSFPVLAASGPSGGHYEAMVKGPGVTTGRSGVIGNVYFVHEDFWPLNTSLWVKQFKVATPEFSYQFLRTLDLKRLNAGSAVPTLNRNHVHAQAAVLPPPQVVMAYSELAAVLLRRVRANKMQIESLTAVRDTLLPRLISGKLRLPESARQLDEAFA